MEKLSLTKGLRNFPNEEETILYKINQIRLGDKIKGNKVGEACSTH